jgi:hypothetical protein
MRKGGAARDQITCASHAASIASGDPYPTERIAHFNRGEAAAIEAVASGPNHEGAGLREDVDVVGVTRLVVYVRVLSIVMLGPRKMVE